MITAKGIADALGEQVHLAKVLCCPHCSDLEYSTQKNFSIDGQQDMASVGDHRERLFCPYCEMEVEIIVTRMPFEEVEARQ